MTNLRPLAALACCCCVFFAPFGAGAAETQTYEPAWQSLSQKAVPEPMKDAKFGIYTHWSPFSAPAHGGPEWDAKGTCYIEKHGTSFFN